jgi:hypothetical protein
LINKKLTKQAFSRYLNMKAESYKPRTYQARKDRLRKSFDRYRRRLREQYEAAKGMIG